MLNLQPKTIADYATQEMDQLKRQLLPILHQLETLEDASLEHDLSSLQLLVRRSKDRLV